MLNSEITLFVYAFIFDTFVLLALWFSFMVKDDDKRKEQETNPL